MQQEWSRSVADAVAPISIKVDATISRLDKMEKKTSADMSRLRESISDQINQAVEEKIAALTDSRDINNGEKSDRDAVSYAGAAASSLRHTRPKRNSPKKQENKIVQDDSNEWFWNARRCLRFFPIQGKDDNELKCQLEDFLTNKLKIPSGTLTKEDFKFPRRIKSTRRSNITDEVLVSFASVRARDLVQSYARNLEQWTDDKGKPTAGLRMEIPDRLLGDHKALEQYGHAMKLKHKDGFRRHIKMDDSGLCLYMDVYLPKQKQWVRVDMDLVKEDNAGRAAKIRKAVNKNDLRTGNSDSDEDEDSMS